jgi:hypothetical protein
MIGAASSDHIGFGNARRSMFSIWNETASIQVLIACTMPSPSLSPSVTLQKKMATPELKAFCVLQFVKHESVVSVQRAFRGQFQRDPPSANSIRRWYQQFRAMGCFVKGEKCRTSACVRRKCGTSERAFSSQSEEICAPCEPCIEDVEYDCVEGVAKETGYEALSSPLVAVSSLILVHAAYKYQFFHAF